MLAFTRNACGPFSRLSWKFLESSGNAHPSVTFQCECGGNRRPAAAGVAPAQIWSVFIARASVPVQSLGFRDSDLVYTPSAPPFPLDDFIPPPPGGCCGAQPPPTTWAPRPRPARPATAASPRSLCGLSAGRPRLRLLPLCALLTPKCCGAGVPGLRQPPPSETVSVSLTVVTPLLPTPSLRAFPLPPHGPHTLRLRPSTPCSCGLSPQRTHGPPVQAVRAFPREAAFDQTVPGCESPCGPSCPPAPSAGGGGARARGSPAAVRTGCLSPSSGQWQSRGPVLWTLYPSTGDDAGDVTTSR